MAARSKARKRALDVLFEADQRGLNVLQVLDARLVESGTQSALPAYAEAIVRGVVSRWLELDTVIGDASQGWTIARMPAVDRAALRIAAWEILCNDEVATAVAIDEAVDLVKALSTDESASFVNGVLAAIARDAPALPTALPTPDDAGVE